MIFLPTLQIAYCQPRVAVLVNGIGQKPSIFRQGTLSASLGDSMARPSSALLRHEPYRRQITVLV